MEKSAKRDLSTISNTIFTAMFNVMNLGTSEAIKNTIKNVKKTG